MMSVKDEHNNPLTEVGRLSGQGPEKGDQGNLKGPDARRSLCSSFNLVRGYLRRCIPPVVGAIDR